MKNSELELGRYQHYKGDFYEVIGIALHSETMEELVVYKALYQTSQFPVNSLWVRPLSMFIEKVNINDQLVSRFKKV